MTTLQYLPSIKVKKNDGNLRPQAGTIAPTILIVGTAGKGVGNDFYSVATSTLAKSEFGNDGTLIRGMWEATKQGATSVGLYRIGATSAKVEGIGNAASTAGAGFVVETVEQDEDAGEDYALYYDDATVRLVVKRNSDDLIVYDNDETSPIDLFEVTVSGYRDSGGGADIGSASSYVNLEDIDSSSYPGTSFTAGTDGLSLSRMEMYEKLYVAYKHLMEFDFDVIVPMDVYFDDYNCVNQGHFKGAVLPVVPGGQTYPTAGAYLPGSDVDSLGKVYSEEYEGEYFFWWWFDDGSTPFAAADIISVNMPGSGSTTQKIDGTALTEADFHEVNFGYQLARFLYDYGTDIVDATGVIGCLPPESNSLKDKARWIGKYPTWTLNTATGEYYIASPTDNGSGLLGNKFKVGQDGWRSGVFGGGMILTDSEYMDGVEEVDDNEIPVDLGKYISVVVDTPYLRNNWYSTGYFASFAASYGGFYLNLPPASAPTNKKIVSAQLIYKISLENLDKLTGSCYVSLRRKTQGLVIADAPTSAIPGSDWTRLSTVRIVKKIVDAIRAQLEPFLGEGTGSTPRASMKTKAENILLAAKKEGYIQSYSPFEILQTRDQEVQGKADLPLTLVPAFELRQITTTINLSKSG